jgi:hypothetical protein
METEREIAEALRLSVVQGEVDRLRAVVRVQEGLIKDLTARNAAYEHLVRRLTDVQTDVHVTDDAYQKALRVSADVPCDVEGNVQSLYTTRRNNGVYNKVPNCCLAISFADGLGKLHDPAFMEDLVAALGCRGDQISLDDRAVTVGLFQRLILYAAELRVYRRVPTRNQKKGKQKNPEVTWEMVYRLNGSGCSPCRRVVRLLHTGDHRAGHFELLVPKA